MTFLATLPDGTLTSERYGSDGLMHRQPWYLRCDTCGRMLPYGCVIDEREHRYSPEQSRRLGYRADGGEIDRCGWCEGFVEQIGLGL